MYELWQLKIMKKFIKVTAVELAPSGCLPKYPTLKNINFLIGRTVDKICDFPKILCERKISTPNGSRDKI
jgi:hypothetical protein